MHHQEAQGIGRLETGLGHEAWQRRLPEAALQALAREVITRMAPASRPCGANGAGPADDRVDTFCDALLSPDANAARQMIAKLRRAGADYDELYLDLLTPAAHRLGTRWEEDAASFIEVSMGIGRIYGILYDLRDLHPLVAAADKPHALFATLPDEEHTLGATIAADLFRERGWDVDLLIGLDHTSLVDAIDQSSAPVIGISAARGEDLAALMRLVVAVHVHRPALRVFVAGNIMCDQPDIGEFTGIDGAAREFEAAYSGICELLDSVRTPSVYAG